jgi:hypothetical protein
VDYRPQKEDLNRVRITVGGNLINYPGELTTRTADLTTAKILWNSTISMDGARYACADDVGNFYLATPMEQYEYMRIKADLIPDEFKDYYKLWDKFTMVMSTAKSDVECTASHKLASLQTNS